MLDTSHQAILVTGGTGLIGSALIRSLTANRIQTIQMVRKNAARPTASPDTVYWNPDAPGPASSPVADPSRLENARAAVHLSGANLSSRRWTPARKQEIAASRINSTRILVSMLKRLKNPPHSLLCASAVGIYGDRRDEILSESSASGQGFLADVCRAWEGEADAAAEAGIRVVNLRFGVVLSKEGGALKQMLPIFRAGLGGRLGNGNQWMSWIALSDLVRAVLHILQTDLIRQTDSIRGPVNLVAPIPVTNRDFTIALGRALHRPAILPVPRLALRAAFGEMADTALLASTRAIPELLASSGFHFDFPEINRALQSIV